MAAQPPASEAAKGRTQGPRPAARQASLALDLRQVCKLLFRESLCKYGLRAARSESRHRYEFKPGHLNDIHVTICVDLTLSTRSLNATSFSQLRLGVARICLEHSFVGIRSGSHLVIGRHHLLASSLQSITTTPAIL